MGDGGMERDHCRVGLWRWLRKCLPHVLDREKRHAAILHGQCRETAARCNRRSHTSMTRAVIPIARCGYAEPSDEGDRQCQRMGVSLTVREPFLGRLVKITRCKQHSDWIQTDEPNPGSSGR